MNISQIKNYPDTDQKSPSVTIGKINDIYAHLNYADICIACGTTDHITVMIDEMTDIAQFLPDNSVIDILSSIKNILSDNTVNMASVHNQGRIVNLLDALRSALYSMVQTVEAEA
tara:strand:- start:2300 stop:2644 length:345 start_codon:yes stop_codon:yes gene_type:complete